MTDEIVIDQIVTDESEKVKALPSVEEVYDWYVKNDRYGTPTILNSGDFTCVIGALGEMNGVDRQATSIMYAKALATLYGLCNVPLRLEGLYRPDNDFGKISFGFDSDAVFITDPSPLISYGHEVRKALIKGDRFCPFPQKNKNKQI